MANFQNNAITESGILLRSHVDMGAIFTATKIVIGSGYIPSGKTAKTMTDVVSPVKELTINKKERSPDGKVIFGGVYTNEGVDTEFYFRELALYAKAVYPDGTEVEEVLYSYGNAAGSAELMAAYSTSTVVERQMDIVTFVGNEAKVDLTIQSGLYLSHAEKHAAGGEDPITPEMIGAAPSGYGLGGEGEIVTDPLSISASGFYSLVGDRSVNYPALIPNALYGAIYAKRRRDNVYLTFEYGGYIAYANFAIGDTAIVWEYHNPPMANGVEYRTTERISGKAVYKKNVNGSIQYRLDGETTWKDYATAVGAASGGYGLGTNAVDAPNGGDANEIDGTGFYVALKNTAFEGQGWSSIFHIQRSDGTWIQIGWHQSQPNLGYKMRRRYNGVIGAWETFATAIGAPTVAEMNAAIQNNAVSKTGDQTMTGSLIMRTLGVTDGYMNGSVSTDGATSRVQILASNPNTGKAGAVLVGPNGIDFMDGDGYEYRVIHEGNLGQFLGVAPASLE